MNIEESKDLLFSDIYPIVVLADNDVSVKDLPFSVRLKNLLMRNHVTTLSAILATNVAEFEGFRNLGTKTVKELTDYLDSLMEEGLATKKETRGEKVKSLIIAKNMEAFLNGDRSFLDDATDDERKSAEPYIEANVYPQRATNPEDMHLERDEALSKENLLHIRQITEKYPDCDVLLAYGNLISKRKYLKLCLEEILSLLSEGQGKKIKIIKLTKANNPVHPLYQSNNSVLKDYVSLHSV